VPEKVRVESVAERLARFWPRAMPEMVEFWSWLLPMVVVETRPPEPLEARRVLAVSEETARLVVVAWVVVAFVAVKVVRVEEALEIKPLPNWSVVDVEFSPVPKVLNGKANNMEAR